MYYILGLNHYIQYVNKKVDLAVFTDFVQYISSLVEKENIELIAEEFNEDCLELNHVHRSILQLIGEETSTRHLFMDPVQSMRTHLGIPSGQRDEDLILAHKMREAYWLKLIKQQPEANILLCIGASHVDSFKGLLTNEGYPFVVMDSYWHQKDFQK